MDLLIAQFKLLPFWPALASFSGSYGLSEEVTVTLLIGALTAILSILMLPKSPPDLIALDPEKWQDFEIIEKEHVSRDTRRIRFALQSPHHKLGLPVGQHVTFKFKNGQGHEVMRSYTPITSDDEFGYVDFVIKVYFPNVHPKFPGGGQMTMHLENLKVGDKVAMKGPKGHVDYRGCGDFTIVQTVAPGKREAVKYNARKFGFIAGGSGITPCLQIIRDMIKRPNDRSEMWLLFANQTEEDILLRDELEELAANPANRFKVHYTLDRPPAGWKYSSGFINPEMCEIGLPEAGKDSFIFACGPKPMIDFAVVPSLRSMGYADSQWFTY